MITDITADLPYVTTEVTDDGEVLAMVKTDGIAEQSINQFRETFRDNENAERAVAGLTRRLRHALKGAKGTEFEGQPHDLVRPAYVMSVASINTDTDAWERLTIRWLRGDLTLVGYLRQTSDGEQKLRCVLETFDTDVIDRATAEFRRNHVTEGMAILAGERDNVPTYLRGVKAGMVARWFFNIPCIDRRTWEAVEGILARNVDVTPRHHRAMSEEARGQARAKNDGSGRVSPTDEKWLLERISRYGEFEELATLWDIVTAAVTAETDIPDEAIPQVAFNVGGAMKNDGWSHTVHTGIYEALGATLDNYEE